MAMPAPGAPLGDDDVAKLDRLRDAFKRLEAELGRVIIGQRDTIERLAICLFARGHALLMGVPGLAKTLLVSKLAEAVSLRYSRIQFTPDLMPMDITGTDILQETADGRREFRRVGAQKRIRGAFLAQNRRHREFPCRPHPCADSAPSADSRFPRAPRGRRNPGSMDWPRAVQTRAMRANFRLPT